MNQTVPGGPASSPASEEMIWRIPSPQPMRSFTSWPDWSGSSAREMVGGGPLDAAAQGIPAGQFDEALRAMRAGVTCANVHAAGFPAGEIRARIGGRKGD